MTKKTTKTVSPKKNKALIDASPECCFWINNGPIVKNLIELRDALNQITDEQFDYHAKRDGNNFAKWIDEVLQAAECAKKLSHTKNRKEAILILERYI